MHAKIFGCSLISEESLSYCKSPTQISGGVEDSSPSWYLTGWGQRSAADPSFPTGDSMTDPDSLSCVNWSQVG